MPSDLMVAKEAALSPLDALLEAFTLNPSAEMATQIAALQIQMERFRWEREERQARIDFDDALNRCQIEVGSVVPNRNRENGITWADYMQIDHAIRPIYTKAGFSLSFSEGESTVPGKIKIIATLSRSGINRQYEQNITPGGNSKMSATDSDAAANSRAQRYLVLKIFNIAVGIAADEEKGIEDMRFLELKASLEDSPDEEARIVRWRSIVKELLSAKDFGSMDKLSAVNDKIAAQFRGAA